MAAASSRKDVEHVAILPTAICFRCKRKVSKDLGFAAPDGCQECYQCAYDAFPFWTWTTFCCAYADSPPTQKAFADAWAIQRDGAPQNFKTRGAVSSNDMVGATVEKSYAAITENEFMEIFRLPTEKFDDFLVSAVLNDEWGKQQKFLLFELPLPGATCPINFRIAKFFSSHDLTHSHLLLEPDKMIRREQPAERFQVLCDAEGKQRRESGGIGPQPAAGGKKPKKLLSWQEIQSKVESVIANREQNESEAHTEARALGDNAVEENDPGALVAIDTLEDTLRAPGVVEPKRKAKAKAAAGKSAAGPTRARQPKAKSAPSMPVPPPVAADTESQGASPSEGAEDELATAICNKIGGDGRAVRNLDVQKILLGEQIGRTLQGARRILSTLEAQSFGREALLLQKRLRLCEHAQHLVDRAHNMPGNELHKVVQPLYDDGVDFPLPLQCKLVSRRCLECVQQKNPKVFLVHWCVWKITVDKADNQGDFNPLRPMMAAIFNQLSDAQEAFAQKVHDEEFVIEGAKEAAEGSLFTNWKALGGCVVRSAVNDYFLHLVSSAPKHNDELKELLIVLLTEWEKLEESGESKSFEDPLSIAIGHVVRCFRGLLALLSPDVGILGSQGSDVEAISKMKRARTLKSGAGGNLHSCEAEIYQLISANDWWGKAVESYWKYAPMALALKPKLELAMQEASSEEFPELTTEWLEQAVETLAEFRQGLLRETYVEYEKYLQTRFGEAHKLVVEAKDGKEVGDLGLTNSYGTLLKGLDLFQTAAGKEMKESLQAWFTEKKSEMLQEDLLKILADGLPSGSLDIVAFADKVNQLKGVELHEELSKQLAAAVPLLFDDLVSKVQHDHSADKEHWDLFASVLVYLPEAEVKILKMECECGHLAAAALGEKDALLNGMEDSEQKKQKKLVSMVAAVNRYLSFCEKLDRAGHFDRTVASFRQLRGVLSPEDAEIQSAIAGAIDLHTKTLQDGKVELENLMAPANNWKATLPLDASLEDTMAAAETTLMTVKGKKLSNAITAVQKEADNSKAFLDIFQGTPFKDTAGVPGLAELSKKVGLLVTKALAAKVEALLVQSAKSKVRKTQKELAAFANQELTGHDLDEGLIHSSLLQFSRSLLD